MKFVGLEPFKESFPNVEVGEGGGSIDLHNDADLREIVVDLVNHSVQLVWTVKSPAWTLPERAETVDRPTRGTVALTFSGLRRLRTVGVLAGSSEGDVGDLDILEYRRIGQGLGEVRLSFVNEAEIELVAERCELRRIGA